jgi:predicted metal-dependent phosphoesterase TrpH
MRRILIDLHMHSVYSDGTDSPAELVAVAEEIGLSAMALTDHDTVAGIKPFFAAARHSEVDAVAGIELSADCDEGTMHILGYFIDPENANLLEKIEKVRAGREYRNMEILKRLNKLGYIVLWSDVQRQAGKDVVGRPHFAEALVERGHVKTKKAAFDLLLAKGRPAYVDRYRFSQQECIEIIHQAGGVAVLAHPNTLNLPGQRLKECIGRLRDLGLDGLETYYSSHRQDQVEKYLGWAAEFGLVATGGTDYHGGHTPDIQMGTGFGQLAVGDEVLENLRAATQ